MLDRTQTHNTRARATLIGRREFTVTSALALLSGVTITLGACSGSDSSSPSTPSPTPTSTPASQSRTGAVSANHGHSATITGAQLTAGGGISLDIRGSADHPHTVQLTGTDLTQIGAGQRVQKNSSTNGGHSHTVTFN